MHRHMGRIGDQVALPVEEGAGEIEALLDVHGMAGVLQGRAHLLGDRHEEIVEHLQHDRIDSGADRGFAPERHMTAEQQMAEGGHLRRPARLEDDGAGGLGDDRRAFDALARRSSVPVKLDVVIEQRLPDSIEIAAYFVVAEALTNAAKHASASEVRIRARTTGDSLSLSISDDGIGGADSGKGSGLIGLKDRIEVMGGRMQVDSPPGSGTVLDITIPHERCGR